MKTMVGATAVWERGGIAVLCEKCTAVRFPEDFPEHAGDERLRLKEWLKARLKDDGRWGPIRVVTSSCLDICARGGVTVLLDPLGTGSGNPQVLIVDPLEGREDLYARIVAELSPRT
jgi:hypothetical protein